MAKLKVIEELTITQERYVEVGLNDIVEHPENIEYFEDLEVALEAMVDFSNYRVEGWDTTEESLHASVVDPEKVWNEWISITGGKNIIGKNWTDTYES